MTAPLAGALLYIAQSGNAVEGGLVLFVMGQAPVHYVENTLINGLFGLLCWPAIFAPLPGEPTVPQPRITRMQRSSMFSVGSLMRA